MDGKKETKACQEPREAMRDVWQELRDAYVRGAGSYRRLAEEYGVPYGEVSRRGRKEGWAMQRVARRADKVDRPAPPADEMARLKGASDRLDEVLGDLLEKPGKPLDSKAVGELSRALKTAIDIKRELYPVMVNELVIAFENPETEKLAE